MDKDLCREAVNDFNKAYKEHDNDEQYAAVSRFMRGLFLQYNSHLYQIGNYRDVNSEMLKYILEKAQRHPKIFEWLFTVK